MSDIHTFQHSNIDSDPDSRSSTVHKIAIGGSGRRSEVQKVDTFEGWLADSVFSTRWKEPTSFERGAKRLPASSQGWWNVQS